MQKSWTRERGLQKIRKYVGGNGKEGCENGSNHMMSKTGTGISTVITSDQKRLLF